MESWSCTDTALVLAWLSVEEPWCSVWSVQQGVEDEETVDHLVCVWGVMGESQLGVAASRMGH